MEPNIYCKEERFDEARTEALKEHYAAVLRLLGEDPAREGLAKRPGTSRVCRKSPAWWSVSPAGCRCRSG